MELVCIDYLSLERSKSGFENILVITDQLSRYAQVIPTRNQTAQTAAKVLFENFFIHDGFPAKLLSDKELTLNPKLSESFVTSLAYSNLEPHPIIQFEMGWLSISIYNE